MFATVLLIWLLSLVVVALPAYGAAVLAGWPRTTVVILACTMLGQAMEDALNPRLRVGHLSVRRFRLRPLRDRLDSE